MKYFQIFNRKVNFFCNQSSIAKFVLVFGVGVDWVTDLENIATQRFEARAHEMEMMMVVLTKSKDVKSQLLFEIMNQQRA